MHGVKSVDSCLDAEGGNFAIWDTSQLTKTFLEQFRDSYSLDQKRWSKWVMGQRVLVLSFGENGLLMC